MNPNPTFQLDFLKKKPIPKSTFQHLDLNKEQEKEREQKEEKEETSPKIKIHVLDRTTSITNIDRNAILERLQMNGIKQAQPILPIQELNIPEKESSKKRSIILEEEKEEEEEKQTEKEERQNDDLFFEEDEKEKEIFHLTPSPLQEKEVVEVEQEEEKVEEVEEKKEGFPEETLFSLQEAVSDTSLFDESTIFVLCSSVAKEPLPGKGSGGEVLPSERKTEFVPSLSQFAQWRNKLCNDWSAAHFDLDNTKWHSVDHFLTYTKYRSQAELDPNLKKTILEDHEKAQEIYHSGKFGKKKLTEEPDFDSRIHEHMYHALYAKLTQNPELVKILASTKNAKIYYRPSPKQKEIFYSLMMLRKQFSNVYLGEEGPYLIEKKEGKEGKKKTIKEQPIIDLTKVDITGLLEQLPKPVPLEKRVMQTPYFMPNRRKFIDKLNAFFSSYRQELYDEDLKPVTCADTFSGEKKDKFFVHQRVVRDYLNLYSPYRGLLIYHSLGAGKTGTSIAVAEGFKSDKQIFVFLPASLKTNYVVEIKKYGDPLYKKNQYWEFVSVKGAPEKTGVLAKALNLSIAEINKKGGAWMVDIRKPSNFHLLDVEQKMAVEMQIDAMISHKYKTIHYNANDLQKKIEAMERQVGGANPFDHSVIIVDEAHNFVSRIVGNIKKKTSIYNRLYHMMMDAQDLRLVFLSGTPIINYPNEMGVMFNLLRGYIKTWEFDVKVETNKKIDRDAIMDMLTKGGLRTYDFIEYDRNHLIITRNPYGFVNLDLNKIQQTKGPSGKKGGKKTRRQNNKTNHNKTHKSMVGGAEGASQDFGAVDSALEPNHDLFVEGFIGGALKDYEGVTRMNTADGNMTDKVFIDAVLNILRENGITVVEEKGKKQVHLLREKALYDIPDQYKKTFIRETSDATKPDDILNRTVLANRILGLTSYFRSAQEKLLPKLILGEGGSPYEEVLVDMSPVQFAEYAKMRKEEYEEESRNRKQKMMAAVAAPVNNHDLEKTGSVTYRVYSRACCNFVFPEFIQRPKNIRKKREEAKEGEEAKEEEIEEEGEAEFDGEQSLEETQEGVPADPVVLNINKRIETALRTLKERGNEVFTPDALEKYSPKFLEILNRITDKENVGLHLLYSNFRTLEGIGIFKILLEQNGFTELKIRKTKTGSWELENFREDEGKPRFVLYTGTETDEQKEIIRNIYNGMWQNVPEQIRVELEKVSKNNHYGEIIKLFMITSAGAEGINLRNTRFVHIMEPYWHNVRVEQVIGRARRICSHEDLPDELRTVKAYLYISRLSEEQKKDDKYKELLIHDLSKIVKNKTISTDEHLHEVSILKQKINKQFLQLIKETAMDCNLYIGKHSKTEPLVCYGYGKITSNEFSSYPILKKDLELTMPEEAPVREKEFELVEVAINQKDYVYDPKTGDVYDKQSYIRAVNGNNKNALIHEGRLLPSGKYMPDR